jgi:hypothetical protein
MKKTIGAQGQDTTPQQVDRPSGSGPEHSSEDEKRAIADRLARVRGHAGNGSTTDEIMSMTRSDH